MSNFWSGQVDFAITRRTGKWCLILKANPVAIIRKSNEFHEVWDYVKSSTDKLDGRRGSVLVRCSWVESWPSQSWLLRIIKHKWEKSALQVMVHPPWLQNLWAESTEVRNGDTSGSTKSWLISVKRNKKSIIVSKDDVFSRCYTWRSCVFEWSYS